MVTSSLGAGTLADMSPAERDWQLNACIGFSHHEIYGYVEGYRRAARLLFEHVAETERDQDTLVYPMIFLWRQAIELQLKDLIRLRGQLEGRANWHRGHHDLAKLWEEARPIIAGLGPSDAPEFLTTIAALDWFDKHDPESDGFRYPTARDGSRSMEGVPPTIHLGEMSEMMETAITLLDGCRVVLGERLQGQLAAEYERQQGKG